MEVESYGIKCIFLNHIKFNVEYTSAQVYNFVNIFINYHNTYILKIKTLKNQLFIREISIFY